MKLCRYVLDRLAPVGDDRLGLVQDDEVLDVTGALEVIPAQRWPIAPGDPLIANLDRVLERVRALESGAPRRHIDEAKRD